MKGLRKGHENDLRGNHEIGNMNLNSGGKKESVIITEDGFGSLIITFTFQKSFILFCVFKVYEVPNLCRSLNVPEAVNSV